MTNPKIRFKADNGSDYSDWKEKSFKDTFSVLNNNTLSRDMLNYNEGFARSIHYGDILINYGAICNVNVDVIPFVNSDIQIDKFNRLKNGDVILADTAEDETVGKAIEVNGINDEVIISGLHTMPCRPTQVYAPMYLGYLLNSPAFHNQLLPYIQGTKVSSIGRNNISNTMVSYPCLSEQQKIADFFLTIDEVIAQSEKEVQNLKQQKKTMMQKIFSREIRFKNDDGSEFPEWEETTFDKYYKIFSGNAFNFKDYVSKGVPIINGEAIQHGYIDDSNFRFLPDDFITSYSDYVLKEGDIVLGLNRPITNGMLKIAMISDKHKNSLLYQRAGKIQFLKKIDRYFSYVFLSNEILKFAQKEAVGSDQPFISTTKLNKWKMYIPKSEQEIKKISMLFSSLDEAINYSNQELEKWKELKKGLLQQMFV